MLDLETKLRKFISEMLQPFNDRYTTVTKDIKGLNAACDKNATQLNIINGKLDREQKVRDQVGDLHVKMLNLVSHFARWSKFANRRRRVWAS